MLTGAQIIAKALNDLNITHVFGVVGIPVMEVAAAITQQNILFISCRNEQSAVYAACAYSYLQGLPGVCLTVSGPGFTNALSGLYNSVSNRWPIILISGSTESNNIGYGGFQELDQISLAKQFCGFVQKISNYENCYDFVFEGYKSCIENLTPSYIDLPAELITNNSNLELLLTKPLLPYNVNPILCEFSLIKKAMKILLNSKKPLLIIGKGAAYNRCEEELLSFVETLQLCFIPMPMAKGLISDNNKYCVSPARSYAFKKAEVIIVIGARLNWMLQFGQIFKNAQNVFLINNNGDFTCKIKNSENIRCDIKYFVINCLKIIGNEKINNSQFNKELMEISTQNQKKLIHNTIIKIKSNLEIMNHHNSLYTIQKTIEDTNNTHNIVLISEGARSMDLARLHLKSYLPRHRLDAGTLGIMGIGLGYAISAQLLYPQKRVLAVLGDSAFGFSMNEIETCKRYNLPIIIVIINNSGIYYGLKKQEFYKQSPKTLPSFALTPEVEYQKIAEIVGCIGILVKSNIELKKSLSLCLKKKELSIINVLVEPEAETKVYYK